MQTATVFNIQKFSINDGPGIRTTVFLKGCMLDCLWCHNPESKCPDPQLLLSARRCIGCGMCVQTCPSQLHAFSESGHQIDRAHCKLCGACVSACVGAIEMCGKEMTVDEILAEVMKDEVFYAHSGGGMTVSGGEPLLQPAFTLALLQAAKEKGLHTCIETSGFADWSDLEPLLPVVDLFLWDVKETDSALHEQFTGVPNDLILANLRRLDAAGAQIVLRCPLIPGCNDRPAHLSGIAQLANSLQNVQRIDVEPYHPLGKSKSEGIGVEYVLGDLSFPEEQTVQQWIAAIAAETSVPVQKA